MLKIKQFDPNQQLDEVLKAINHDGESAEDYQEIRNRIDIEIEDKDLFLILSKLVKDGYAGFIFKKKKVDEKWVDTTIKLHYITFEGKFLLQNGGYVNEQRKNDDEKLRIYNLENHQKSHDDRMFLLSLILCVIGAIASWYYLTELCKYYGWYCWLCH